MKRYLFLAISVLCALWMHAADRIEIALTPDSAAMLYIFPAENPNGLGVISCPGGGYAIHAMDHEGFEFADWFNSRGINYAVLRYRLPYGNYEIPASDGYKAIGIMKEMCDKTGVMGFSAGGHLASTLATHYPDPASRPDFQILFYPVISMDASKTHYGSRENLLGKDAPDELVTLYSNECQVTADTPEALIFHCADDKVVPVANALDYCAALAANDVPVTMSIFPTGGHGWGFHDSYTYKKDWTVALDEWLKGLRNKSHE